jgi:dihydropteroate synthase
MDYPARFFPRDGHESAASTPWNTAADFSTVWKLFFHSVEKAPASPHVTLRTPRAPILMGILNLTPDSFSDGGHFLDPAAALDQALALEADGADLIDVGAESTRPGYHRISATEELRRLLPVLDRLADTLHIPISVDTSKAAVAQAAFDHGAVLLNDVAALSRPGMAEFARQGDFPVVLMHGVAHVLPEDDPQPSATIAAWLATRIHDLQIDPQRIVIDPGIGFGITRAQDAAILENLAPLVALGYPLLMGLSRKRIVRILHPDRDRDDASAQMAHHAWQNGAAILRLHELKPIQRKRTA